MKIRWLLPFLIIFFIAPAWAQNPVVTATITGSDGCVYQQGTYNFSMVDANGNDLTPGAIIYIGGGSIPTYVRNIQGTLDGFGHMSVPVLANSLVTSPAGTQWRIGISSRNPVTGGGGAIPPMQSFKYITTINSTVDLSGPLSALAPALNCKTGGGGANPGPPFATTQYNNSTAFAGNGPTNGLLYGGATPGNQIDAACSAFGGGVGTVLLPPGMGAGLSVNGLPAQCNILDYRGNSMIEPYGTIDTNETQGLVTTSAATTASNLNPNTYVAFFNQGFAYSALRGGNNSYQGTTGQKTNYFNLFLNNEYRTVGQKSGIAQNLWSMSAGDTIGDNQLIRQFGGYGTNGDENTTGRQNLIFQGNGVNDGSGGVDSGTITATNSSTGVVTYSAVTDYRLGEQRFIRDLGSKFPITYTSAVYGGSPPSVTITSSTTITLTGFVGTHTTYNNLATGGEILTNNMVFCPDSGSNGGYDACVPITTGTDTTHFNVNLYSVGSQQNTQWQWATSGTGSIYRSAWPTSINRANTTFTACNPMLVPSAGNCDVSGLTVGHSWDQVMAYNMQFTGERMTIIHAMGISGRDVGTDYENQSPGPSAPVPLAPITAEGAWNSFLNQSDNGFGVPASIWVGQNRGAGVMFDDRAVATTTPWNFYRYNRSDSTAVIPIAFDPNIADPTEGLELFGNTVNVHSNGTATIPVVAGGMQVGQAFNIAAGVLGTYSNLLAYSEFQSAGIGGTWIQQCSGGGNVTVTQGITDPLGGTTAIKMGIPASPGCAGQFSSLYQTLSPALTASTTYVESVYAQGNVGNETMEFGVYSNLGSITTVCNIPANLPTTWNRYNCVFVAPVGTTFIRAGFGGAIGSQNINYWGAQLEAAASPGFPTVTGASPLPLTSGVNATSIIDSGFAAGTAPICPNGTNGAFTTTGCGVVSTNNLTGGALGSMPYQSAANTTLFVSPQTTASTLCMTETGTGSVGAAPVWGACSGSAATAWAAITAGTNTGQALLVGNSSSLGPTGTGTITATALSGAQTLPNGSTATTQAAADNTTKVATDAFVLANSTQTICHGTQVLSTSAISVGGSTTNSLTCTGALVGDNVQCDFASDPSGVAGYDVDTGTGNVLTIYKGVWTANTVTIEQKNSLLNPASITPGAMSMVCRVTR